jgi:ribA/ribD-fused uncharacterized protein
MRLQPYKLKIAEFRNEFRFLSNFYPAEVVLDGLTYKSVEHAYQAAKTLDLCERDKIVVAPTPGESKRVGRSIRMRQDWEDVKVGVMKGLLIQKFSNPELKRKLLDTGDAELVEGNKWGDCFWGVCAGIGKNMLGKLLMEVRNELKGK